MREFFYNVRALGDFQRLFGLSARGGGSGHTHIFQNRRFNKTAVLENEGYLVHKLFFRYVPYVYVSYEYAAALRIEKSGHNTCKSCFSSAGGTHKGNRLAGGY